MYTKRYNVLATTKPRYSARPSYNAGNLTPFKDWAPVKYEVKLNPVRTTTNTLQRDSFRSVPGVNRQFLSEEQLATQRYLTEGLKVSLSDKTLGRLFETQIPDPSDTTYKQEGRPQRQISAQITPGYINSNINTLTDRVRDVLEVIDKIKTTGTKDESIAARGLLIGPALDIVDKMKEDQRDRILKATKDLGIRPEDWKGISENSKVGVDELYEIVTNPEKWQNLLTYTYATSESPNMNMPVMRVRNTVDDRTGKVLRTEEMPLTMASFKKVVLDSKKKAVPIEYFLNTKVMVLPPEMTRMTTERELREMNILRRAHKEEDILSRAKKERHKIRERPVSRAYVPKRWRLTST